MSTGVFVPRTPNAREIFLGEGAVWANYTGSAVFAAQFRIRYRRAVGRP